MADSNDIDLEHELLKRQFREITREHEALVKSDEHDRDTLRHHREKLTHKMLELREHAERLKEHEPAED